MRQPKSLTNHERNCSGRRLHTDVSVNAKVIEKQYRAEPGKNVFSVRVVKYDVNLRESSVRAVHAMHGILSHMVKFIWNDCKERLLTFYPAYFPLPSLPQLGAQDGVALCCSGICLRCQRDMGEQLKDLGGVEDLGQVVAKCFQENHMDPRFRFPWIKKALWSSLWCSVFRAATGVFDCGIVFVICFKGARVVVSVIAKVALSFCVLCEAFSKLALRALRSP